jgi:hypothetical protein
LSKILFSGVEIPSNRTLLERSGAENVTLNYWGLRKRGLPKTKAYLIGEYFMPYMKVWVDSGATQADKSNLTKRELDEYAADYEEFIAMNYDRIEGFTEFDSQKMGLHDIMQNRAVYESDPKLWVVWHEAYSVSLLEQWGSQYANIAIPGEAVEAVTTLAGVVRRIKSQSSVKFHGLAIAKPDILRSIPFDTVTTLAWISPMRRGETIVWDGVKLNRYPKRMKDQARKRYRSVVEKAGLDFQKFVDDDTTEATKVAVWSYLQLESSMSNKKNGKVSDNSDDTLYTGLMETGIGGSNNSGSEMRKVEPTKVVKRNDSEIVTLPVFGVDIDSESVFENGVETVQYSPKIVGKYDSLRQCNTCFVRDNCPAFKEDNECAFNLPVEVKTKDQMKSLLTAIVEMQAQRVAFMRFQEELNGGYADPNVSQEIERLFKIIGNMKDLETNKEFVQITASRETSNGVLSQIFGDKAHALKELNKPIDEDETTRIIHQNLEGY